MLELGTPVSEGVLHWHRDLPKNESLINKLLPERPVNLPELMEKVFTSTDELFTMAKLSRHKGINPCNPDNIHFKSESGLHRSSYIQRNFVTYHNGEGVVQYRIGFAPVNGTAEYLRSISESTQAMNFFLHISKNSRDQLLAYFGATDQSPSNHPANKYLRYEHVIRLSYVDPRISARAMGNILNMVEDFKEKVAPAECFV